MGELTIEQVHEILVGQVDEKIEAMEGFMMECPQVEIPAVGKFINGMYVREIVIPKGTLLTGRVHKYAYLDIMLAGDITVATRDGVRRMQGYCCMEGVPGRKRAGYAHEDTRWLTVHRTDQEDPATILDHLTFFNMSEYRDFRIASDRASYAALISVMGMTEEQVSAQVHNTDDMIVLPDEYSDMLEVGESPIHGIGLFSLAEFQQGGHIGPARINGMRTEIGRYSNHSADPNAAMVVLDNGDIAMIATRLIRAGDEITTDYAQTIAAQGGSLCQQ